VDREFLAPSSWSGRETTERKRVATVFFASGRKGLSLLPLRFRLFLFLPLRHDFQLGKKSSFRTIDQIFDELIVQTFSTLGSALRPSAPADFVPLNSSQPPSVFDSTLIVRNQMTRLGMISKAQASKPQIAP
jgi:hypothetical protein